MAIYKYVNKVDSDVTLSGHVFTALGELVFTSDQADLTALDGISVDGYIDGVPMTEEYVHELLNVIDMTATSAAITSAVLTKFGAGVTVSATTNGNFKAGTTAVSSMRIAEGVAPTTPVDGDVWVAADHKLYIRLNGVTKEIAFV